MMKLPMMKWNYPFEHGQKYLEGLSLNILPPSSSISILKRKREHHIRSHPNPGVEPLSNCACPCHDLFKSHWANSLQKTGLGHDPRLKNQFMNNFPWHEMIVPMHLEKPLDVK